MSFKNVFIKGIHFVFNEKPDKLVDEKEETERHIYRKENINLSWVFF